MTAATAYEERTVADDGTTTQRVPYGKAHEAEQSPPLSARHLLTRRLLPTMALAPIAISALCWWGEREGLYGPGTALVLLTTALVATALVAIASVARELSRLDAADDRAERVRGSLAAIIESSDDAVVGRSLDGRVETWNRGAEQMYGYGVEEAVGTDLEYLHDPDRTDEIRVMLDRVARGEAIKHFETKRVRKDGTKIDVSLSISPIRDEGGSIVGASFISRDVTERRRLEEERAATLAELQRSNAELEQFAYIASHDLSEPLRVIGGFVQLLQRRYRDRLDEDADRYIDAVVSGATRMQGMIDALLAYSRVGRAEILSQPVDTVRTVEETVRALDEQIRAKGAEVVVVGELPLVNGDPALLGQVFQNLISNAVKFTDGEAPRVEVSAAPMGTSHRVFSVADNGAGIDPKYAERIFEMFQRLHARDVPGLGIGLSMCKRIVDRHGGRIWVEAAPAGGSVFRFTVPGQAGADDPP